MAEQESGGKKTNWLKAFFGTVAGLFSGAAVMYVTPLVDKAVKPAKPIANFRYDLDGLTARFQNLSNGGQGYWDFGDGSPLEPVGDNPLVSHTFPRPGEYAVKLSLHNVLNEENERSVTVKLDGGDKAGPPQVVSLDVQPLSAGSFYAPASFKLSSRIDNAQLCVWDFGDDRPFEVVQDSPTAHERTVTFPKAGGYVVKLLAVNGTRHDEKTQVITVMEMPPGMVSAVVTASDAGARVERKSRTVNFGVTFPQDLRDDVYKFEKTRPAAMGGFAVADLRVTTAAGQELRLGNGSELAPDAAALGLKAARNLRLAVAPDRQSVKLTGELVRDNRAAPPGLVLPVVLTEQRQVIENQAATPVSAALGLPGGSMPSAAALLLPPATGLIGAQRQLHFELRDGANVLWQTSQIPASGTATVQGRRVIVSVTRLNDQVNVSLIDAATVQRTGN